MFILCLDESITTHPNSTSEVYYCIRGKGRTSVDGKTIEWKRGDFMSIPAGTNKRREEGMNPSIK